MFVSLIKKFIKQKGFHNILTGGLLNKLLMLSALLILNTLLRGEDAAAATGYSAEISGATIIHGSEYLLPSEETNSLFWMKISATTKEERSLIANTGVTIEIIKEDYVVATGYKFELENVKKNHTVLVSFPLTKELDFPKEDEEYHNFDRMKRKLVELQQKNEKISRLISIGKSHEQRDLFLFKISKDPEKFLNKPAALFVGGHHAREHLSVEIPLRFIEYLLEQYSQNNQRIVQLIETRDIHIIPALNPDGLEYDISGSQYKYWRKNRRANPNGSFGVDLNRNYGYKWGTGGSSSNSDSDTYMGPSAFSEPETKALKDYIDAQTNITVLLSFHTFSELILYPWGNTTTSISDVQDRKVYETMAKKMSGWNHYTPEQTSDLYVASGDLTDWSYGVHKIFSFTFELDPSENTYVGGFYPGAQIIPEVLKKNIEPCLYLLEVADNPFKVLDKDLFAY